MGSPIVRLIDDILADIFTLVARECRAKRVDGWGPFKWIIVSHVCRHWRTIALDHAALWADQGPSTGRLRTCILPIRVRENLNSEENDAKAEPDPAVFKAIEPYASRIRSLSMDVTSKLHSALSLPPSLEAVRLESLNIHFFYRLAAVHEKLWFLSDASLGSLTKLKLNQAPFLLTRTLVRTTLTRLIFHKSKVSVANWIDLLSLTPFLEFLELCQSVVVGPESLPLPGTKVALSQLRKLILAAEYNDDDTELVFASLLTCLQTPIGCSFAVTGIESWSGQYHPALFSALASKLPATSHSASSTPPLRACVVHLDTHYFYVELWHHPDDVVCYRRNFTSPWGWAHASGDAEKALQIPDEDDAPAAYPFFRLSLQTMHSEHMPEVLSACLSFLPLSAVTSLSLFVDTPQQVSCEPCLYPVPSAFPHVTDLYYVQPSPQSLLRHLAQPGPSGDPSGQLAYPLFPCLQTLTLHSVSWHDHGPRCLAEMQELTPRAEIGAMLDARRAMGMPLVGLRLECLRNLKDEDKPLLAEMAETRQEVTWDMEEGAQWHIRCKTCPDMRRFSGW